MYVWRAPGGYGPCKAARTAEADGTDDDGRQAYDENRFPSDHVSRVTPNVAAQESAKRESARDVAGVVPCYKHYPRTTAATAVNAVANPPTQQKYAQPIRLCTSVAFAAW